jgi:hypothetical protein
MKISSPASKGSAITLVAVLVAALATSPSALAGPPYVTDDPQPTDLGHHEIYAFTTGAHGNDARALSAGIDFNYGALPGLQLTAVIPWSRVSSASAPPVSGLDNIELAAKYRFIHSPGSGWAVALFPRVFLPAGAHGPGERNASLLLPLWVQKSGEGWSSFGGGGCALHRGGDARDYCMVGIAYVRELLPALQLGIEIYHSTADAAGGDASTGAGLGLTWDINEHLHLMGSAGPGLQHRATTDRDSWYLALLLTL